MDAYVFLSLLLLYYRLITIDTKGIDANELLIGNFTVTTIIAFLSASF